LSKERGNTLIANNKKAYHEYFIEEKFEAGIELVGTEVKSIRQGHCSIKEAFVGIDHGEVYVYRMNINPYERGNIFNKDPLRTRKLLLQQAHRTAEGEGLYHYAAQGIYQRWTCQDGDRSGKR